MEAQEQKLQMGMRCIKYMMFVSNFMFVLIGFLLISIGSTVLDIYSEFEVFLYDYYFSPARLTMAVGIIIFFVALFGCFGAIKQSTMLLNLYSYVLIVLLILEISAALAAYAMRGNLESQLENNMWDSIKAKDAMDGWNSLQEDLKCCGINNSTDWKNTTPKSCYEDGTGNLYTKGCLKKLTYFVSECALLIGIGTLCVAFIQILGIIFAQMLAKAVRRLKTEILVVREHRQRYLANLLMQQQVPNQNDESQNPRKVSLDTSGLSEA